MSQDSHPREGHTPPLPVPEVPAVMWRKVELVEAVQLHPEVVMTVKGIPWSPRADTRAGGLNE